MEKEGLDTQKGIAEETNPDWDGEGGFGGLQFPVTPPGHC